MYRDRQDGVLDSGGQDNSALITEITGFIKDVYNLAYKLIGNRYDAEDLTQDTLMQACKKCGSIKDRTKIRQWLHKITVNLYKNRVRYEIVKKFRMMVPLDLFTDNEDKYVSKQLMPVEQTFEKDVETKDVVHRALAQMKPDERILIVLCDIERYTMGDAAKMLGLSRGTVQPRVHSARESFRKIVLCEEAKSEVK
ncbi:MAG: sigma-70 family RNA polymerase sigma factor [Elusimicrobiota bacterium]